ncbi:thiamine pyrophosphate-binding protein [Mesorhizobium sp. P5_C1]
MTDSAVNEHSSRTRPNRPEVPASFQAGNELWGSDRVASLLAAFDLKYLCLNPGSSFRGLHDSIVNFGGNANPQMLVCLHEEHAVAIAHGYAKVTGKPLAVALHANVGLMHATMAIFNAWCDRVPMLILGGTGPVDAAKRRPFIDWIHCARDQGSMIRGYVKWDDQPASLAAAEEAILRGMQLGMTAPQGPIYINLDSEIQEEAIIAGSPLPSLDRYQPVAASAPNEAMLKAAAAALAGAKHPVILMGRVSRDMQAWAERVTLAERLGAMVITDLKVGAAFPTAHPLHAGAPGMSVTKAAATRLKEADVILSLDWVDLAGVLATHFPGKTCRAQIIQVSVDHQLHNGWSFDHQALPPVDIHLATTPEAFASSLLPLLPTTKQTYQALNRQPAKPGKAEELGLADIAFAMASAARETPISLLRIPLGWDGALTDFDHPLDQLGHSGGGGVGSGPGMAVGSALALMGTDRLPVAVLGDGDTLMGITALWTAVHYGIPLLVVVANNRSYFNDELHQERVARRRDRPVENKWIGQRIDDPAPDIAMMARAQGAEGVGPIREAETLDSEMRKAVAAVQAGKVVVLDVHIGAGYAAGGAS